MKSDSDSGDIERELTRAAARELLFPSQGERPSVRVGRFEVRDKLGAGGMGTVMLAWDPDLDREIALKLLHPGLTEARARLIREAKTLARVEHPNVVSVYEVGEHRGQVFIAMELVRGRTLREWLDERSPERPAVLDALAQAGRGLLAAHEAGIVHRDFKPDNVIVGDDGRVRVVDFGLAIDGTPDPGLLSTDPGAGGEEATHLDRLTTTGTVVGTPAYLAPEQFQGDPASPASDQFSFCVSVYEVLWGDVPFPRTSLRALRDAVTQGTPRPAPTTGATRSLASSVMRGLAREPAERFESLEPLVEALETFPRRVKMRRWAIGTTLGGVATLGLVAYLLPARAAPCASPSETLASMWNESVQADLRGAFEGTAASFAQASLERLSVDLAAYAEAWSDASSENCRATLVDKRQSPQVRDLRHACLARRRNAFVALTDAIRESTEPEALARAQRAASTLPTLEPCHDVERLLADVAPPSSSQAPRVEGVRARLAEVDALVALGRYTDAVTEARAALEVAAPIGYEPIQAEAELALGHALTLDGHVSEGAESAEQAHHRALQAEADELVAQSGIELLHAWGTRNFDRARAERWAEDAELWTQRVEKTPGDLHVRLWTNLGAWGQNSGDLEAATQWLDKALELRRTRSGEGHPGVAVILGNLGNVAVVRGELDQAQQHYEAALEHRTAHLGPDHPELATNVSQLANLAFERGDYDRSETLMRRALSLRQAAFGEDHPSVAESHNNLGVLLQQTGRVTDARAAFEKSLAIHRERSGAESADLIDPLQGVAATLRNEGRTAKAIELYLEALELSRKHFGGEDARTAAALINLGDAYFGSGDDQRAIEETSAGLEILERTLGAEHPDLFRPLANLGFCHEALSQYAEAEGFHLRALAVAEPALGKEHPALAYPLTGIGTSRLAQNRALEAVEPLERAAKLWGELTTADSAHTNFVLAQALWDADRDRARAVELATRALKTVEAAGNAEERASIERWLASHSR